MNIYVDGSASTQSKDNHIQNLLMDEAYGWLDDSNPDADRIYGFNHEQVWPITKRSDQGLHLAGASLDPVLQHNGEAECVVVTDDPFLADWGHGQEQGS